MIESGKNDLLNEISSRNEIIGQMKDLLAEKDRAFQEQGEIKEREMKSRDETIAQLKSLLEEKDEEIKVCATVSASRISNSIVRLQCSANESKKKVGGGRREGTLASSRPSHVRHTSAV